MMAESHTAGVVVGGGGRSGDYGDIRSTEFPLRRNDIVELANALLVPFHRNPRPIVVWM